VSRVLAIFGIVWLVVAIPATIIAWAALKVASDADDWAETWDDWRLL